MAGDLFFVYDSDGMIRFQGPGIRLIERAVKDGQARGRINGRRLRITATDEELVFRNGGHRIVVVREDVRGVGCLAASA